MGNEQEQTYVHDNIEVILTSRTATKTLRSGKAETLYEITPKLTVVGSWRKWVRIEDLYKVDNE